MPFLVTALDAARGPTPIVVLGTLAFTAPYGLLRADDIAPRARLAAGVVVVVLFAVLVAWGGADGGVPLALAAGLAVGERWSNALDGFGRLGAVPVRRATDVVAPMVAALAGTLLAGAAGTTVPWLAILALGAWLVGASIIEDDLDLSARSVAWLAAIGFGVAAAVTATIGPTGALAALALDLFLLVAVIALADPAAARRQLPGLTWLVGAWIAALLLAGWHVLPDMWPLSIIAAGAAAGWALVTPALTWLVTRLQAMRMRGFVAASDDVPPVVASVVGSVGRDAPAPPRTAAASLQAQTYADLTVASVSPAAAPPVAESPAAAPDDPTLHLLVDASVDLTPIAVRRMVEAMQAGRLDALSGWPRESPDPVGPWAPASRLVFRTLALRPLWLAAMTRGRPAALAWSDPRILLVRRSLEERVGRDARDLARAGGRVGVVDLGSMADAMVDQAPASILARWRSGDRLATGGSLAAAVGLLIVDVFAWIVPMALPILALATGAGPRLTLVSGAPLALMLAARAVLATVVRAPLRSIAWHPLSVAIIVAGDLLGIADAVVAPAAVPTRTGGAVADGTAGGPA